MQLTGQSIIGRRRGNATGAQLRAFDPTKRVAGVLMTQVLPFADPTVLGLLDRFERAVYATQ